MSYFRPIKTLHEYRARDAARRDDEEAPAFRPRVLRHSHDDPVRGTYGHRCWKQFRKTHWKETRP